MDLNSSLFDQEFTDTIKRNPKTMGAGLPESPSHSGMLTSNCWPVKDDMNSHGFAVCLILSHLYEVSMYKIVKTDDVSLRKSILYVEFVRILITVMMHFRLIRTKKRRIN